MGWIADLTDVEKGRVDDKSLVRMSVVPLVGASALNGDIKMFNPTAINSIPTPDPTTLRAIQQLASVVNDVETRLNIVKAVLEQSVQAAMFTSPTGSFSNPSVTGTHLPTGVSPLSLLAGMTPPTIPNTNVPFGVNPLAFLTSLTQTGIPGTNVPVGINPLAALLTQPGINVNALALLASLAQSQNTYGSIPTNFGPSAGVSAPFGFHVPFAAQNLPFRLG